MDTNIGVIELTEKQITNLNSLKTENIKGFSYWNASKEVIVVSETEIDIDILRAAVIALPDEYSQEYMISIFNTQKFLVDCQTAFTDLEKIQAMPYQRSFESMLDNNPPAKNFTGLLTAVSGLIQAGALTESHLSKMVTAIESQGVIL